MDNSNLVSLSDDVTKQFTKEAIDEAKKDFSELFLQMFSEARSIAAEESGATVTMQIDRGSWQKGKWYVLRKRRSNRYRIRLAAVRFFNVILSIGLGFWLADLRNQYGLVIAILIAFGITFFLQERWEAER